MAQPEERIMGGRRMVNRALLAAATGLAEQTLANLYSARDSNGHPEGTKVGRGLFFDKETWDAWYERWEATKRASMTTADRSGDPDELVDIRAAARILGYSNPSTIRGYITRDEAAGTTYFPPADEVRELPSGFVRRRWKRRTIWAFADSRGHRGRRGGAPTGSA
ncbi:MAG: hypothetical protein AB7H92_17540 [Microbacteriaceae bacterium]